jgi:hypothetical protein
MEDRITTVVRIGELGDHAGRRELRGIQFKQPSSLSKLLERESRGISELPKYRRKPCCVFGVRSHSLVEQHMTIARSSGSASPVLNIRIATICRHLRRIAGCACLLILLAACRAGTSTATSPVSQPSTKSSAATGDPVGMQGFPAVATYPIPDSPYGSYGTQTDPIGTPTDSDATCATVDPIPGQTLSIAIESGDSVSRATS